MSLFQLCQQLEQSPVGAGLRESAYAYPIVQTTHVLALGLAVGTIIWFDLRLAGVAFRDTAVSRVFHQIRPWMGAGFVIMIATGSLLFSANATECYNSVYFRMKLGLLLLAGINIAIFHLTIDRRRMDWDRDPVPPKAARIAGIVSIVLWLGIIAAGRFTAYNL